MRDPNRCTFSTTAASQQVQIFIARSRTHICIVYTRKYDTANRVEFLLPFCLFWIGARIITLYLNCSMLHNDVQGLRFLFVFFSVSKRARISYEVSSRKLTEIFYLSASVGCSSTRQYLLYTYNCFNIQCTLNAFENSFIGIIVLYPLSKKISIIHMEQLVP